MPGYIRILFTSPGASLCGNGAGTLPLENETSSYKTQIFTEEEIGAMQLEQRADERAGEEGPACVRAERATQAADPPDHQKQELGLQVINST